MRVIYLWQGDSASELSRCVTHVQSLPNSLSELPHSPARAEIEELLGQNLDQDTLDCLRMAMLYVASDLQIKLEELKKDNYKFFVQEGSLRKMARKAAEKRDNLTTMLEAAKESRIKNARRLILTGYRLGANIFAEMLLENYGQEAV